MWGGPDRGIPMKKKFWSTAALALSAVIAGAVINVTPAYAAAATPTSLSWTSSTTTPTAAADATGVSSISAAQTRYPWIKFTTALSVGDAWAIRVSITKPATSQVSMTDSNGSIAGATSVFTGLASANWGTPAYSSVTGLITANVTTAYSATTFARIGSFALTPDVPGVYEISLVAMEDTGSGWQDAIGVTQKFTHNTYDSITATATRLQTAAFGTGVDLDGDGNIFWADASGNKLYKTTPDGVTSQFAVTVSNTCKVFVDGAYVYSEYGDVVYRTPLNNTNPTASPSVVQSIAGALTTSAYAQGQGFTRIAGFNYIATNIPHAGEVWKLPAVGTIHSVSAYSIAANVVTLTVPAGHGYVAGDVVNTSGIGSVPWANRTITAVSSTSISFSYTAANVASTALTAGQVTKSVGSATLLTTLGGAVRGMVPSSDGRYLYLAYATGKQVLRLDTQNLSAGTTVFADLNAVNFAPDDVTLLGDGSIVVSAFSPGGVLWHIGSDGRILNRINMTLNGTAVGTGYDLRVAPDGSKIYLAAQSSGFLSLALSKSLPSSNHGSSNLIAPTSGPTATTVAAASVFDPSISNISTTSAVLRGSVNPNGAATQARLRYSVDPTFPAGSTTLTPIQNLNGSTTQTIEYSATGLTANTVYYVQVMAGVVSPDEVLGAVRSFNTSALPGITAQTVATGPAVGGTAVQLTLQGFSSSPNVFVGGVAATNVVFTAPNTLTFTTPAQSGAGILLELGSLAATAAFSYSAPSITNTSPSSGDIAGGFAVTIAGSNFTGASSVTVDGNAVVFALTGDSSITFTAPSAAAGSVPVVVTTPAGASTTQLTFTAPAPTATATPTPTVTASTSATPSPTPSSTPSSTPLATVAPPPSATASNPPSATPTPTPTASIVPVKERPAAVTAVKLAKTDKPGKSKVTVELKGVNGDVNDSADSIRVLLRDAAGKVVETIVVPLSSTTATIDLEIPLPYGNFDVSVAAYNSAGYSTEVASRGGLVKKSTIKSVKQKWPTVRGYLLQPSILFKANSSTITSAGRRQLADLANRLRAINGRILVSGFAAKFGPESRGRQIALARAENVAKALQALGLANWIEYHGYGQLPEPGSSMRKVQISVVTTSG